MAEINVDNDATGVIYEAAQAIKNDFEHDEIELRDVFHTYDMYEDGELPQYRVHVHLDLTGDFMTYTFPVADLAREHGLYLFDACLPGYDDDYDIKLRFGYEPEE